MATMTPPTVAPGSVVVMRRHDASPSSFYLQQTTMGSQQDSTAGNKPKKSWGERLKLGKSDKNREERPQTSPGVSTSPDNNYLLQEYRNKYGTLSSGSALSKSMKYAETWLYGSVAVRAPSNGSNPRPSLFLYQHPPPVAVIPAVIPPGTNYAVVMCSCPEFLTGTARSKKSSTAVCKKCGGSRMLWNVNKGGGTVRAAGTVRAVTTTGTVRGIGGTLRLGGGSSGQNRVRPSLLNLTSVSSSPQNPKSPPQQPLKATTPDPYDLMRRNRLGGVNNNDMPMQYELLESSGLDTLRVRAKSTSPCRRRRSPSPPRITNTTDRASRKDRTWEFPNWSAPEEHLDNSKRKSILECDVTAYELIAKYLKNGNRPPIQNGEGRKLVVNDDLLDDELSDDLSDNALENSSAAKNSNIPTCKRSKASNTTTFQSKTDTNNMAHKDNSNGKQLPPQSTNKIQSVEKTTGSGTRNTGVTLGGQRVRIFNKSTSPSPPERDNDTTDKETSQASQYIKMNGKADTEVEPGTLRQHSLSRNTNMSSSLIPRLTSPRRPPRKLKGSEGGNNNDCVIQGADEIEIESAMLDGGGGLSTNNQAEAAESSPPGLSSAKDGRSLSTAEGACIIKSILKKPSTLSPGDTATSLKTFGDTISKPDSGAAAAAVSSEHSPSPEVAAGSGSTDFYLPTFQEFKQQIRKKKQVQFKVANDITVLQPVEEEQVDTPTTTPLIDSPAGADTTTTSNRQSPINIDSWIHSEEPPVKHERRKDRVPRQEGKQLRFKNEKCQSFDVREDETAENCDKDTGKQLRDNDEKLGDKGGCEVKLQYFGEGDVTVVNSDSNGSGENGAGDVSTASAAGTHAASVVGGINDDATLTASTTGEDLVNNQGTVVTLRRSQSERLLPTSSGSLRGCDSRLQQSVDFNDTMRLRLRPGRPDIRQVFSDPGAPGTYTDNDTAKRPQRMLSPGRPRPKEPPPPPPPPSFDISQNSLPELPPRQIFPFTKKQIEQMNSQARQFSIKAQNKQKKIATSITKGSKSYESESLVPSNIRPVSWSPLMESTLPDTFEVIDVNPVVKKKEHRHSDPGPFSPKLVVRVDNPPGSNHKDSAIQTDIDLEGSFKVHQCKDNQSERNSLPKMSSKMGNIRDNKVSTIVTVSSSAPGSPLADIHRLQIKSEDPVVDVSPGPQRRTSIIITNDQSPINTGSSTSLFIQGDSTPVKNNNTNKVTICVGGASDPNHLETRSQNTNISSSCTIIDTSPPSTLNLSKAYNKQNCSSLTLLSSSPNQVNVIPVSPEAIQRTLLVVDHNDVENKVFHCWGDQSSGDIRIVNNNVTVVDNNEDKHPEAVSNIVLTYKSRGVDISSETDNKEVDILLNPVEAVKRNLIPHVCGKKNTTDDSEDTSSDRLSKLIQLNEGIDDNDRETMKEGDYCMAVFASKFLENNEDISPLYSNVSSTTTSASKSSEDTLPTVLEQEEEGDDDVFRTDSASMSDTDEPSSGAYDNEDCNMNKIFQGDSSGCETAPSSIEPENQGTEETDEDSTSTSRLHLSLSSNDNESPKLEKDNQEGVELNSEKNLVRAGGDDDNLYESIKDPIYEEIPDTPPPLPLSPPPSLDDLEDGKKISRSIFEGASKDDILSYLVGAKERGIVPEETYYIGSTNGDEIVEIIDDKPLQDEEDGSQNHQRMTSLDLGDLSSRVSHLSNASDSSEDSCNLIISNIGDPPSSPNKVRKSSAEIERNDSGVGSETSKSSRSRWQHCGPASSIREDQQHLCEDCDQPVETQVTDCGVMFAPLVCRKCGKKRAERKEIIAEIVETEEKYGRDLQIIMDEFYSPMLVAGLLTPEQLAAIFLNVEELLEHNAALAEKLRDNLEIALEQGDEDLLTVNIGKLFLEAAPMLHSFESYCIRQGAASLLLANLEKEKELLRIFLRVSQMENAVLRRMNLNSFLMVPVQRVTKYPLLLARLYKVTPAHHEGRELLKQAQQKIELHLEHMNAEAKDISTTKLWRRISIMNGRRASSETDMLSIKLRKMALDILEWNHDEVRFAMEGKLLYTNPADNNWRKSRTIKLNPINALLVTHGKPTEDYRPDPTEDSLMFPRKTGVREATLLLLKEKCGRYTPLREPLYLDKCIVCSETDSEEYFEVQELASKDTFIFKAEDGERTRLWYRQLQYHAQGLGAWRRRRNALANIMITRN